MIEHPSARATVPEEKNSAAYMVIHNRGAEAERLLGARTGEAQRTDCLFGSGSARRRPHLTGAARDEPLGRRCEG